MDIDPIKEFKPGHPMADENGFIYRAPVNIEEEEYVDMLRHPDIIKIMSKLFQQ